MIKEIELKRILAPLAIASLALAACGSGNISPDAMNKVLVERDGFSQELADCITGDLDAALDDDDFSEVAEANNFNELEPELGQLADEIVTACVNTGG